MSAPGIWKSFAGKRILLLQGPVGPFFWKLARVLSNQCATVHKVNFNGGDWLFYPSGAVNFIGWFGEWPIFLDELLVRWEIDVIFLFGDCRRIHRIANEIARRRGIEVVVFEEGYVRPNYITMERFGVNGHSMIPRSAVFFRNLPEQPQYDECQMGNTFWHTAAWAIVYYTAATVLRPAFWRYRHHRALSVLEGLPWLRGILRKGIYAVKERGILSRLTRSFSKKFFLVSLQVTTDAQVLVHSDFESVPSFIEHVIASFAAYAPSDCLLVLKHHPMDRGYHDYSSLVKRLAREYLISQRVFYIHDQHLPTLLEHSRGVVLINSTVGLSALRYGLPVIALGTALYDFEGLSYQGELKTFWVDAEQFCPDVSLYRRFRTYLVDHTQLNGSFYKGRVPVR